MTQGYDVEFAVLGGGPAGYLAAIRAAQLGVKTAIIEQDQFGGVCLNRGCIPTKALLRTVELAALAGRGQEFGVMGQPPSIDWVSSHSRKNRVVKSLRLGVEHLLKVDRIQMLRGYGSIINPHNLEVETGEGTVSINCKSMLIATGSLPMRPNIPGIHSPSVMTSDELLAQENVPERLAIIGGGVIGLEFAQMFNGLGAKITIIEMAEQVLPNEDLEIADEVLKCLKRQGIQVHLSSRVVEISYGQAGSTVRFITQDQERQVEADFVLLATGRKPAVPAELLTLGIQTGDHGEVAVNSKLATSIPGIYAAGDVTGGKMLAHKAYAEGRVVVENLYGSPGEVKYQAVPSCVYIQPELATVGMNETEAIARGYDVKIGRFPFRNNGRALCLGEREGLVKVVTDRRTHVVLGAQILGPGATELISELTLAVSLGLEANVIADIVHPHPSLSEAVMEACADAVGRAIHKG